MTPKKFFLAYAGYSYDHNKETASQGRQRAARAYVKAEEFARDNLWSFHWSIDRLSDSSDWTDEKPAWQQWQCCARDGNGALRASLHGIDFGRDGAPWGSNYRRVVEAELTMDGQNNSPQ